LHKPSCNPDARLVSIQNFFFSFLFSIPQEAEISIKFYRGIQSNALFDAGSEQLKIEFESIKSLISERADGGNKVELKDFCKRKTRFASASDIPAL
jgi:hypothetical protein